MFIDQAKIFVKAGDGGRGCASLYRDKYMRFAKRNGGDGGRGADIIVRADRNIYTLLDFHYNRHFRAAHGGHASSNNKRGRDGEPVVIRVPVGTVITDLKSGCILRDLKEGGEQVIVAVGGKGGLGNIRSPEAMPGEPGEEKNLSFDLKLIAEVGLVGFPNAGKSTLIANVSNAQPKIAAYPFTTKFPILGVVKRDKGNFVIADIPGLIEGSSKGRGLGDKFLRHIERTKILIHLVDISGFEGRDPIADYKAINSELKNYSKEVAKKPQIIALNKMDLEGAKENLKRFKKLIKKTVYPISALRKEGLEELMDAAAKKI
ncbi:MAG: GTPase ObgE [Candidatus Omnitrophica bacterium CG08_land_8_20_14_0_20_41_16]|uniref:GTPase Obg n=1 Tax=Candidatus Sherwoodlollariibacterium unditelluris TaxID=1974757 RepID=A0A2G9YJL4_9BACT|nr:MAG: GTPase ObgE [Candidatus Omnitrophica bacterium CG23_combo_of_CG06-09_8_20_14_all_41_10]PIS34203.1 MAG: GTPase ObgE [Candidatus Omnitrophica bacterium CG08_land_8_20_14_0_20_41_16]